MRLPVSLFLSFCAAATLAAQVRVPPIPTPLDLPLPGIDRVLRGDSPISTTLKDARRDVPILDRMEVTFGDLATLRNSRGTFTLRPGHWAMDLQSFCFHAGTRGPQRTDGQGYLSGRIDGPDSAVFVDMLSKYALLRDVEQQDMQVLIWALLSRTRIRQMNPQIQALAVRVLTPAQILALDSGALDVVPLALRQRALDALPADVRAVADAENRIRDALYRANHTYAELERIAVIEGPEPRGDAGAARSLVAPPGGYFIRYKPTGYARTTVEIAVPPKVQIRHRDTKGRIISIDFGDGRRLQTEMRRLDSRVGSAGQPARRRLRLQDDSDDTPRRPGSDRAQHGMDIRDAAIGAAVAARLRIRAVPAGPGWEHAMPAGRNATTSGTRTSAAAGTTTVNAGSGIRSRHPRLDEAIRDLEDAEHYRDGLDAALRGGTGDRLEWIIDHQERQNRALERAIIVIDSLPTTSSADDEYVPPYDIALPSHAGSQRLGLSGRGF